LDATITDNFNDNLTNDEEIMNLISDDE